MKTLIVYIHLIAACIAIGVIFIQDLSLAKTRGHALPLSAVNELIHAASVISNALKVLWISGLVLVLMGYLENPETYLTNEKLWAKFSVVSILTLNGVVLHNFSFPRVVSSRGVIGLDFFEKNLVIMTGVISTVSWLFSCYLGIARPWNHTVEYAFVMSIYLTILGAACLGGCSLIHFIKDYSTHVIRRPVGPNPSAAVRQNIGQQIEQQLEKQLKRPGITKPGPLAERISRM